MVAIRLITEKQALPLYLEFKQKKKEKIYLSLQKWKGQLLQFME